MRKFAMVSLAAVTCLLAGPALAEGGQKLTREQIVCQMTGDCDAQPVVANSQKLDKGQEAGFSFRYTSKATTATSPAKAAPLAAAPARAVRAGGYTRPAPAAVAVGHRKGATVNSLAIPISFTRGSADLSADAREQVSAFAAAMQSPSMATRKVMIEGHTDSKGARPMNLDLSERRAHAVADFLVAQHIDPSRVKSVGFGPDRPLPGHDASSPDNRRVQFSFAD